MATKKAPAKKKKDKKGYAHLHTDENGNTILYGMYRTFDEAKDACAEDDTIYEVTAIYSAKRNVKIVKGSLADEIGDE